MNTKKRFNKNIGASVSASRIDKLVVSFEGSSFSGSSLCGKSDSDWELLLGTLISNKGGHRRVYEHKFNPLFVIKKCRNKKHCGSNVLEFEAWRLAKLKNQDYWLASCVEISESGRYLIQVRGDAISEDDLPDVSSIPSWLNWDVNNSRQWVRIDNKLVVCDYGHNQRDSLLDFEVVPDVRNEEVLLMDNKSFVHKMNYVRKRSKNS